MWRWVVTILDTREHTVDARIVLADTMIDAAYEADDRFPDDHRVVLGIARCPDIDEEG